MRVLLIATVALAGCASSRQLSRDANVHMADARRAAAAGDYGRARDEQRRAEYAYQRAAERARDEGRPQPPPPDGAPLPIFDPQMQR
jgi:predicted Zn-dependent protease